MRNAVIERDVGAAGAMGGDLQNALGCVVLSGRPLRQRVEDELKEGEGGVQVWVGRPKSGPRKRA